MLGRHYAAFASGAVVAEAVAFALYYVRTGYQDGKVAVGATLSAVELAAICGLGGMAFSSWIVGGRLTSAWSRLA